MQWQARLVAYCALRPQREYDTVIYLISGGLLLLYLGLLLLGRYGGYMRPTVFSGILSAVFLIELCANAAYGINCNGGVTRSIYIADQKSYQTLMDAQNEPEDAFFRSEVDRQRMRNVTMYAGGNAMVMFNSTMHGSVIDFCDRVGIEARTNKNGYLGVTKLMNDVLGIRYVASPSKTADTFYQFERVGEDGELALYKNDAALSLGFMVNDAIIDWDIQASEPRCRYRIASFSLPPGLIRSMYWTETSIWKTVRITGSKYLRISRSIYVLIQESQKLT